MKKGSARLPFFIRAGVIYFTRARYSLVRVSISILSPISTKAGTWMVYVGPYKSREIMARRADQLRQLEIAFEEARDLPDEYIPGFVFGRYGVEADARALQTRLTSQKIRYVRVVPLVRPAVSHTVRIPKADPAMRARLAALKPRLSGNAFEPCGR